MKNYTVAPGEYLAEWMEEHPYITQTQLATRVGVSRKLINEILNAKAPISSNVATRLERVTSIPAKAWLLYQAQYDADCARLDDAEELAQYVDYISSNLAAYLRKIGATDATRRNPGQLVADFLDFIHCGTIDAFQFRCETEIASGYTFATLRESSKAIDPAAFLAWIAQAEKQDIEGQRFQAVYSETKLREIIPAVRERAQYPDKTMLADIQTLLFTAGITMLRCVPPKGLPLHGVTYWVNDAPVVVFTERRRKDGYITWAIFHELGHVLHDAKGDGVYGIAKTKKQQQAEESMANGFARYALFGSKGMAPFHGLTHSEDIRRVAREVGVSPGLAVAEMHKRRMLNYKWGNDLLVDVVE